MPTFHLDERLQNDCHILSQTDQFYLLLFNNALIPWFILVPKTDKTELYELDEALQNDIMRLINRLSVFIKQEYEVDKLNIATIGNVVKQLHIHVIGRYKTDLCWPGVVWGVEQKKGYQQKTIDNIKFKLKSILEI